MQTSTLACIFVQCVCVSCFRAWTEQQMCLYKQTDEISEIWIHIRGLKYKPRKINLTWFVDDEDIHANCCLYWLFNYIVTIQRCFIWDVSVISTCWKRPFDWINVHLWPTIPLKWVPGSCFSFSPPCCPLWHPSGGRSNKTGGEERKGGVAQCFVIIHLFFNTSCSEFIFSVDVCLGRAFWLFDLLHLSLNPNIYSITKVVFAVRTTYWIMLYSQRLMSPLPQANVCSWLIHFLTDVITSGIVFLFVWKSPRLRALTDKWNSNTATS